MTWLAVLAGGAFGTAARHLVNVASARVLGTSAPYATAMVNLAGSLAIGLLAGALVARRFSLSLNAQTFVFVGILGGFTTFSSFMLDSLTLLETGRPGQAVLNLGGQLLAGLMLVYAGYRLGQM